MHRLTLLVACAALGFGGCALANTEVVAEDDSVAFLGARASYVIDRDPVRSPSSDTASTPSGAAASTSASPDTPAVEPREAFTTSVDLLYSYGSGGGQQTLGGGQVVTLGGETFSGPETLEVGLDLTQIVFDLRAATPPSHGFSGELFCGLEYDEAAVQVREGSLEFGDVGNARITSLGPALGAALVWEPAPWARASLEGRAAFGFSSSVDQTTVTNLDLGLTLFPTHAVGVYLGWRRTSYRASVSGLFVSDVRFDLEGPMLSLVMRF